MITLLIMADDLTGSLDTGVQFAKFGIDVQISNDVNISFDSLRGNTKVLVINTESRPLHPHHAYRILYEIGARAKKAGIPYLFKKTDSALRGNIGAELTALLDGSGREELSFIPAYPAMGRLTIAGRHYVNGVPVNRTAFGKDPYEPVRHAAVSDVIGEQSEVEVVNGSAGHAAGQGIGKKIVVYDSDSQESLERLADLLYRSGKMSVMAGCAGLAAEVRKLLFPHGQEIEHKNFPVQDGFLVFCGSLNRISQCQIETAVRKGFKRWSLSPQQKLEDNYWSSEKGQEAAESMLGLVLKYKNCIIDTTDEESSHSTVQYAEKHGISSDVVRRNTARSLSTAACYILERGYNGVVMLIGGDTLCAFLQIMDVDEIIPLYEIAPGIVAALFTKEDHDYFMITKSGGFGDENLLADLAEGNYWEERRKDYEK